MESCPRPSLVLKKHFSKNQILLSLEKSDLTKQIAYRGDHLGELRRAARSTNALVRSHYDEFIQDVGDNMFPLIVANDYEPDGLSGVGTTLTLYRSDGSVTRVTPALHSNYELYKACSHIFMGLGVEVGPYLLNSSLCAGSLSASDDESPDIKSSGKDPESVTPLLENAEVSGSDVSWKEKLTQFVQRVRVFRHSLLVSQLIEGDANNVNKCEHASKDSSDAKAVGSCGKNNLRSVPPLELCENMLEMLTSAIDFCETCLSTGKLDLTAWKQLNESNFPRIKKNMQAATKAQADALVQQVIEWRDLLGPYEWRDLYVVVPTVWAVGATNPRTEIFSQLMDEDRAQTHIICSEWPRDHKEARKLLGRVVGDRAIGRFVFGDESHDQRIKVMGLSSMVDVVQDDALPSIYEAIAREGCPVRAPRKSSA